MTAVVFADPNGVPWFICGARDSLGFLVMTPMEQVANHKRQCSTCNARFSKPEGK